MSKIEGALKKTKSKLVKGKTRKSSSFSEKEKEGGKNPGMEGSTEKSQHLKPGSKMSGDESYIKSAVEKKWDVNTSRCDSLDSYNHQDVLSQDADNLIQQAESNELMGQTHSFNPTVKIDGNNVDEHIVSYYDFLGKQTWEGPVMVHFRRLQISLNKMLRNVERSKVLLVASATQKEGKSTIALNTAITLCNNDNKVVIIDCDLRKPSINRLLGFKPDKGVSDYISEDFDLEECSAGGLIPGLTVIPAGNRQVNICELLVSIKMRRFISRLREEYDYVIIDTPPVLAFPDTAILAPLSDGIVFVINSKSTNRGLAKRAIETLHECRVIGCVLNRSEISVSEYYGYGYGYGSSS
ncbi:MAG: CpsD/CapB family tyrosine-protein kinase [Planctomycetes bacterium]|nr:CpsD/CapB family tyrosine-protein kinase [Planctomycetota bacterium]